MAPPIFFVSSTSKVLETSVIYLLNKLSLVGSVFVITNSPVRVEKANKKITFLIRPGITNHWDAWIIGLKEFFQSNCETENPQLFF